MNKSIVPEAFFDSLSLAHKLDNNLDGFKLEEIHLFAYFSSILYLYRGNPVSDWQYRFTLSELGYPFSDSLYDAIERHNQNGWIESNGIFYSITSRGTDQFNELKLLKSFSHREEYLNASCVTSILMPYSKTLRALLNDPVIAKAKSMKQDDWLDQSNIYQKFMEISKAVGVSAMDLLIPAVTWVNYIDEINNKSGV
ncbi:MAG: hypothetical protein RDU76_11810 [Candidatus Edwardsbacteria bacterium]|nr:hypothetical protein [Candidatus Edwardsbacteria bacterium]